MVKVIASSVRKGNVLDVSGMSRLEALKTLTELLDMGAIGFSD